MFVLLTVYDTGAEREERSMSKPEERRKIDEYIHITQNRLEQGDVNSDGIGSKNEQHTRRIFINCWYIVVRKVMCMNRVDVRDQHHSRAPGRPLREGGRWPS
jgi:hypothetical protein